MVLLLGYLRHAEARETFNTHALELDSPGQAVADLSAFAEADGQLPGTYRVTVYVNGEQQGEAQETRWCSRPRLSASPGLTAR
ncbi:FimD/PapC N-terminal domain-containing protein [Klebsiella aerogenes]|uniref:FimD/PapC N-terminal domain-containing protein n=1 Tax=Klebsiella aerogenes TaxID=548 RepID=UPI001D0D17D4|nr:FimD/PapC N-terminal domain-containing protein [Klebsiella aerogenes]